jgi:hypothetical protein
MRLGARVEVGKEAMERGRFELFKRDVIANNLVVKKGLEVVLFEGRCQRVVNFRHLIVTTLATVLVKNPFTLLDNAVSILIDIVKNPQVLDSTAS